MRYADLKLNDATNGEGVVVSFWLQGCDRHCPNCHNPETWDFEGGKLFTNDTLQKIIEGINKHNVNRNFSVLGGEPLHPRNLDLTLMVISEVRKVYPTIKIYVWTGYTVNELKEAKDSRIDDILSKINFLIDGPYVEDLKDLTLLYRGSSNQQIIKID